MKPLIILSAVIWATASFAAERVYSTAITHVLAQLREEKTEDGLPFVKGIAIGYGGSHGAFYFLVPYLQSRATIEDLQLMLADTSPVVRIAAAKILRQGRILRPPVLSIVRLHEDSALVAVEHLRPAGVRQKLTVAQVVKLIEADPMLLEEPFDPEEEPNQPPQTTPVSAPR
ncbi:MAG: hypothetical protein R3F03_05975 [Opitutaceae bacterium]